MSALFIRRCAWHLQMWDARVPPHLADRMGARESFGALPSRACASRANWALPSLVCVRCQRMRRSWRRCTRASACMMRGNGFYSWEAVRLIQNVAPPSAQASKSAPLVCVCTCATRTAHAAYSMQIKRLHSEAVIMRCVACWWLHPFLQIFPVGDRTCEFCCILIWELVSAALPPGCLADLIACLSSVLPK